MWFQLLTNVTKNFILYVSGVVDWLLSLLSKPLPMCLSVRDIGQLVTHGEIMRVVKSVLCKTIAPKDIISKEQFRKPTVCHQVLISVDKLY